MPDYKNGELKIIHCKNFMTVLKSSWIRRLTFSQSNYPELFKTQFGHSLQTIINSEIEFIDTLKKYQRKPFGTTCALSVNLYFRPLKILVVTLKLYKDRNELLSNIELKNRVNSKTKSVS